MAQAAQRCAAYARSSPAERSRCLRCATAANRSDVAYGLGQQGVLGQGIRQGAIVHWRGGAKNGLGELAIAIVAGGPHLEGEGGAAGGVVGRRGEVLFIPPTRPAATEQPRPSAPGG